MTPPPEFRIFDSNVHLPDPDLADDARQTAARARIEYELNCTVEQCGRSISQAISQLVPQTVAANVMIFNQDFASDAGTLNAIFQASQQQPIPLSLTILLDFRDLRIQEKVQRIRDAGFRAIKFHSYVQKITDADFADAVQAARYAEAAGLAICIDTSYGGLEMYRCDNLKLAIAVASHVKKAPVVLLHSGGARVYEALLLAESQDNVFLDSSFSLTYYQGSRLVDDLAFAWRKLGCHRVLYGSDHPYIPSGQSLRDVAEFLDRHGFSPAEREQATVSTAQRVFGVE